MASDDIKKEIESMARSVFGNNLEKVEGRPIVDSKGGRVDYVIVIDESKIFSLSQFERKLKNRFDITDSPIVYSNKDSSDIRMILETK